MTIFKSNSWTKHVHDCVLNYFVPCITFSFFFENRRRNSVDNLLMTIYNKVGNKRFGFYSLNFWDDLTSKRFYVDRLNI